MLYDVDMCLNTIYAWRLIGYILYIVRVCVPIVIIVISTKSFYNGVIKGKQEELSKALIELLKKIAIGIIIFLIPTFINISFKMLTGKDGINDFIMCTSCMDAPGSNECSNYILKYDSIKNEEIDLSTDTTVEGKSEELSSIGDKGEDDKDTSDDNIKGTKNIIIGDSRTVGMCVAMSGSYDGCTYSGNVKVVNNDIFIAKGSQGYTWFNSTAIGAVNNIISDSDTTYNIFSLMGVNYLLSDIDNYITKYNSLASNEWKNYRIILVSVTPVNETIEASHGYSTKNANIEIFNNKLKNGVNKSNVTYCDVYNQIKNDFGTSDGLHYNSDTYKKIYNIMMNCI